MSRLANAPHLNRSVNRNLYCAVTMDRGAGFGNRLFPWARAKIFSGLHHVPMLAPAWVQPRLGQLLRGGNDLKAYHRQILLMGLFERDNYVRGIRRFWLFRNAERLIEPPDLTTLPTLQAERPGLVFFEGGKNQFADLRDMHEFLLNQLRSETKPKWRLLADRMTRPIAINVRCGNDFKTAKSDSDYFTKGAIKTPLEWFILSLRAVRQIAGCDIPAVLVSDGSAEQLAPLLAEPYVSFVRPGCAISDLLTLAGARVLIGSRGSSFSAWGSFLSAAPTITHPGQSLQWFKVSGGPAHYVSEFDPLCDLEHQFSDSVLKSLARGPM